MRTGNRFLSVTTKVSVAVCGGLSLVLVSSLCAKADTTTTASPAPPPAPVMTAAAPQPVGVPVTAPTSSVTSQVDATKSSDQDISRNLTAMEDKVSESAKNVVKRLDTTADTTTLADLNSARQTVTRIEAMIDVEKRLAELDKLRNERNNGHSSMLASSLASAIPASALAPLPKTASAEVGFMNPDMVRMMGSSHAEIRRIFGSEGRYTAVLKFPNGEERAVKVGDEVGNGGIVRSISTSSVVVEGKGEPYTLHIKNVDTIYSAMR